ncbi:hypothetical protein D1872_276060 [compost metagenome]
MTAAFPFGSGEVTVLTLLEPSLGEQLLHDDFVHPRRRSEHAGSNIRKVRHLEQSLDRTVFPVGSVQQRKSDVDRRLPLGQPAKQ